MRKGGGTGGQAGQADRRKTTTRLGTTLLRLVAFGLRQVAYFTQSLASEEKDGCVFLPAHQLGSRYLGVVSRSERNREGRREQPVGFLDAGGEYSKVSEDEEEKRQD